MNAIKDTLKKFRSGVDFTENEGKIIFHNEELVNHFIQQLGAEEFFKVVKELIPSTLCSYEENGRGCAAFVFKSGNSKNNKKDNSQGIEKQFKENTGIDITHHGKNSQGGYVISRKFKNPEIEGQKNKLIEEGMKDDKNQVDKPEKSLSRHFIDNGDSLTYSVERKDKNSIIRESHIERDKKEVSDKETKQEKTDENSSNSNKQNQQTEKENNQQNQSQKIAENKGSSDEKVFYGIGAASLVVLAISMLAVWIKKKR